jgi:hypothetical protein
MGGQTGVMWYPLSVTDVVPGASHQMSRQGTRRRTAFQVGLAAFLVLITLPWSSQAAALALHSAQCGHLPIVGDNFAAAYEYYLPSDGGYWDHAFSIVPFFGPSGYWCTEKEARSGYHHAIFPGI